MNQITVPLYLGPRDWDITQIVHYGDQVTLHSAGNAVHSGIYHLAPRVLFDVLGTLAHLVSIGREGEERKIRKY